MGQIPLDRSHITRFAWLSIAAAILTIGLKTTAYFITGSVGLLSDALESIVNLVGALMALSMLTIAARPPDEEHSFGHSKAEYFSSGLEGSLILAAAGSIIYTAVQRLISPKPLEQIGIGLAVSVVASLVNLGVAIVINRAGKKYNSISLISNSRHLMTDVWTSGGVLIGVGAVALTGWQPLDSIVAILAAVNILWTGFGIMRGSVSGLMDSSLPAKELETIHRILSGYENQGVQYHNLRTRMSGAMRFISLHVRVPGEWTVERAHTLVSKMEDELKNALADSIIVTHIEAVKTPSSPVEAAPGDMKTK